MKSTMEQYFSVFLPFIFSVYVMFFLSFSSGYCFSFCLLPICSCFAFPISLPFSSCLFMVCFSSFLSFLVHVCSLFAFLLSRPICSRLVMICFSYFQDIRSKNRTYFPILLKNNFSPFRDTPVFTPQVPILPYIYPFASIFLSLC
jgi:hypothetical protein